MLWGKSWKDKRGRNPEANESSDPGSAGAIFYKNEKRWNLLVMSGEALLSSWRFIFLRLMK